MIDFPVLEDDEGSLTPMEKSLLGHFVLLSRPGSILELGVLRGVTTGFLCGFVKENDLEARVIGFDFPNVVSALRATNTALAEFEQEGRLELVGGRLPDSLQDWLLDHAGPIELALIDAHHDFRSVTNELSLIWPCLAQSGFILCHDYSRKYEGVSFAVDRFAKRHRAMMLPLTSAASAGEKGHGSVLVALAKPQFRYSVAARWRHHSSSMKQTVLETWWGNRLWFKYIKPLVRGKS